MTTAPVPAKTRAKVPIPSATSRRIGRLRFARADEGAHHPPTAGVETGEGGVVPRRAGAAAAAAVGADAVRQRARVVDAGDLELDVGEAGGGQQLAVLPFFERAGDA